MKEKVLLSWSGGKDSSMTLYELRRSQPYEVAVLLTTLTETYDRISMHGVRRELLEQQAEAVGVPLHTMYIPQNASNDIYEARMRETLTYFQGEGIQTVAFGDIFLEDLRTYREDKLATIGMNALFPIWKQDSSKLIASFLELGFKAVVTCIDPKVLDSSFVGRVIDREFLNQLPVGVDPCGENGEFHSFVFDGPIFQEKLQVSVGEKVLRDGFWFCDLLPTTEL